jgi:drug/metabolite transporter (DMT)-like permease
MFAVSLFSLKTTWLTFNSSNIPWLILIGLLALGAQIAVTLAAKHAPMRLLGPFFYFAVLFGVFLDRLIWEAPLTLHFFWGCLLIVLGNVLMIVLYPKDDLQIRKRSRF